MGGDVYDRNLYKGCFDPYAPIFQREIHPSCDPKRWKDEKLEVNSPSPIVFALDVTGSMGEWVKIIYEKMPMFYGQLVMQKYLKDPCISFCAVGDAYYDKAPLQITEFGKGIELDQLMSKIYLEGEGGGNGIESYEYAAYFYDQKVNLINQEIPFFFFTGDEGFYDKFDEVMDYSFRKVFGENFNHPSVNKTDQNIGCLFFKSLMTKYNVFGIKKEGLWEESRPQWVQAIGNERVLDIKTPKACIDIILGAITLTNGCRTLDEYVKDLIDRGQSEERVKEVVEALTPYWNALQSKTIVPIIKNRKSLNDIILKIQEDRLQKYGEKATLFDKIEEKMGGNFPKEFRCSLSKKTMLDPVVCSDGETFERISIENWIEEGKLENPFTGQVIEKTFTENVILKKMISEYCEKNL